MTPIDDELAALLALDALGPDEQADAELRAGTFPPEYLTAVASLAESVTLDPPTGLRASVLGSALARRAPGRPVDAAGACRPLDAFVRTIEDLRELLDSLTEAEWDLPAHTEHGTVRELMAHLVGVERLSARWLDEQDDVPPQLDHVSSTRPVVDALADADSRTVAQQWHESALAVVAAAATGNPRRAVTFHDLQVTVSGLLVTRTFELWAHAMDISLATDRPIPRLDQERMALLSGRLMAAVPLALAYRDTTARGRAVRFVLTGASGGCYTVPLHPGDDSSSPDATVVADAFDVCRVAARRLAPDDLDAAVEGDRTLVDLVLAGLDAFARD